MSLSHFLGNCQRIIRNPGCSTPFGLLRHSTWHFTKRLAPLPLEVPLTPHSKLQISDRSEMNGCVALAWGQQLYDYHNMSFLLDVTAAPSFCRACLDIGANIGIYSLLMSEAHEVQVHAFEPHPATFVTLQKTRTANHRQNIILWNKALSDADGEVRFSDESNSPTNRILTGSDDSPHSIHVPSQRGDTWCKEQQVRPDIIKIDAEGAEEHILLGLGEVLLHVKVVLVEENVPLQDTLLGDQTLFLGPLYVHYPSRTLGPTKHAHEDAVYINHTAVDDLQKLGYTLIA